MVERNPNTELPVTVSSPESVLRSPGKLLRSMWHDLRASRELAWQLTLRDIKAKYRQSVLGILWAFLPPVATEGLFVFLQAGGVINVGETEIPYVAYALFGTTLWALFVDGLMTPMKVVTDAKSMLVELDFPREALILSAFGQMLFNAGIRMVILVAVFLIFQIEPTWWLLLFPLAMLMLMLLGTVIGMVLLPVSMLYLDITQALIVITPIWMLLTPVVYAPPEVGFLAWFTKINPVSFVLVGARDMATLGTLPNVMPFAIISGLTIVGLFVVWVIYRVALPIVTERISA